VKTDSVPVHWRSPQIDILQSVGHEFSVSAPSQVPSPQLDIAQSVGHDAGFSELSQRLLPHIRQSRLQRSFASHTPLHAVEPQSAGQEVAVSPEPQVPLPQPVCAQSAAQLTGVSLPLQLPSPQPMRQSSLQVVKRSSELQTLSPQKQSDEQLVPFSVGGAQMSSPQSAGRIGFSPSGARPHAPTQAATNNVSKPQRAQRQPPILSDIPAACVEPMIFSNSDTPPGQVQRSSNRTLI
jgi:hypothetical protein